jgi:hypothetical protein
MLGKCVCATLCGFKFGFACATGITTTNELDNHDNDDDDVVYHDDVDDDDDQSVDDHDDDGFLATGEPAKDERKPGGRAGVPGHSLTPHRARQGG